MGILRKIADKIAYERESFKISSRELAEIRRERPDLFGRKGKDKN